MPTTTKLRMCHTLLLCGLFVSLLPACGGEETAEPVNDLSASAPDVVPSSSEEEDAVGTVEQEIKMCNATWKRVSAACCGSGSPKTLWRRYVNDGPHCKAEYQCRSQTAPCAH